MIHAPGEGEAPELYVDPETVFTIASFNNCTMISDWDVLTMIYRNTLYSQPPIACHQAAKKPYTTALSLHALLNVDADNLAID